jgi:hypothetical protein
MHHTKKVYYFQAESKDVVDKWVISMFSYVLAFKLVIFRHWVQPFIIKLFLSVTRDDQEFSVLHVWGKNHDILKQTNVICLWYVRHG